MIKLPNCWCGLLLVGLAVVLGCGGSSKTAEQPSDGHERMLELLATVREQSARDHLFIGDSQLVQSRAALQASSNLSPEERFKAHWMIGFHLSRLGQFDDALASFEKADKLLSSLNIEPKRQVDFLMHMASTALRSGEMQNCVDCANGESCLLPLQGGGVHSRPADTRKARDVLRRLVKLDPDHKAAKYLLNIVSMALGDYPQGVPESYRIAQSHFAASSEFPRFKNIAASLNIGVVNLCGGTVIDDFDNDGFLDILTSTYDTAGALTLYRNLGNGEFRNESEAAGLKGLFGGLNMVQADYDNDGDVDVLVLRGGWLGQGGRHPNSLLQNDGQGRFRDVTFEAGLGVAHFPTQTASWADYNNDGDLDLFVGNEHYPCQLFDNDGEGYFVDVATHARVENRGYTKGVIWGDYNNDRLPDLYVSNLGQKNRLYRNDGDGTFTDVAPTLGVDHPIESFPTWFWDYNNDGALDLYVSSYWADVKYVAAEFLGEPHLDEAGSLYENDGKGGFRDVAKLRRLSHVAQTMGCNFGDLDNDGWCDMYLGTGYPGYEGLMPNLMYRNAKGVAFENVTYKGGFGHLQKGHAIAFGDLDNDGDQDIYCQLGGAYKGDAFGNALFENPGFRAHWIGIKLIGTTSNRSAIGARIRVVVLEAGQERSIYKWVNSGGSFGANPLAQQIGIGASTKIAMIEVYWPSTGKTQVFKNVAANQFLEITEGRSEYRVRKLKRIRFAPSK